MTSLLPISKLLSFTTNQGFIRRYINFSWDNWFRNGKSSKLGETKIVSPLLLKLIWSLP